MNVLAYALLVVAGFAVRGGYLALLGAVPSGAQVWWTGMLGPFVLAGVTLLVVQAISMLRFRVLVAATSIYAIVVSLGGILVAVMLYAGRNDRGQNHSEYALLFLPLWIIAGIPSPILVGVTAWKRFAKKRPNQSPEPTVMSVTPPAAQEPRQP
jgi:hypothetical protein